MRRSLLFLAVACSCVLAGARPARAQWPTALGTDLLVTGTAWFSSQYAIGDGAGGLIVVWADTRATGGPGTLYAQRYNAAGVRLWASGGVAFQPAEGGIDGFRICSDDSGGVVAVWYKGAGTPVNRVFAQRVDASGQVRWGVPAVRVCTLESSQTIPRLAPDGAGGFLVTWFDTRSGTDELYGQRLSLGGQRLWADAGLGFPGTFAVRTSEIVTRTGGGAYLVWWNTSQFVRCGAVDLAGSPLWSWVNLSTQSPTTVPPPLGGIPDGLGGALLYTGWGSQILMRRVTSTGPVGGLAFPLNSGSWGQGDVQLASDGAGGAYVTWLDGRDLFNAQVRAQHVLANDTLAWIPNGELVTASVLNSNGHHAIASDGAGGMMSAWSGAGGGHAGRFSFGGAPLWPVHPAGYTSNQPRATMRLIPSTNNSGIVVWQSDFGVYAKRFLGNGGLSTVGAESSARPSALALAAPSPNPVRGAASLRFTLPAAASVRLAIHDAQGRLVRVLAEGERQAGAHAVTWDGRDASGSPLAAGLYFARLRAGGETRGQRFVALR